jgi:probable rRNA maturation factor
MNARDRVEVEIEAEAWSAALPGVEDLVQQAAQAALVDHGDGGVVILLTDDAAVGDLNARFRDVDAPTNVLAFPAGPNPEDAPQDMYLGDVALAFGVCEREALDQGKPLADHLRHLVIHGVLHLLGYDHQDDVQATAMESRERELLAGLGVPDPYAHERASDAGTSEGLGGHPDVAKHAVRHG